MKTIHRKVNLILFHRSSFATSLDTSVEWFPVNGAAATGLEKPGEIAGSVESTLPSHGI